MTLPYTLRLVLLCFASFFLVLGASGFLIWALREKLLRFAGRLNSRSAARLLFAARLLPAAVALICVLGICAPSYLRFEQNTPAEQAGPLVLALAALGVFAWILALRRGMKTALRSAQFSRLCRRTGRRIQLTRHASQLVVIQDERSFLAQVGFFSPHFVISQRLLDEFSEDELAAALAHEHAHWLSRDNLKRLLFACVPDAFPFGPLFASVEREWAKFVERAADENVAASGESSAVSLAAALVRLARLGAAERAPSLDALATSPLAGSDDLAERVGQLLAPAPANRPAAQRTRLALVVALAALCLTALAWPATLSPAYQLLERLLH